MARVIDGRVVREKCEQPYAKRVVVGKEEKVEGMAIRWLSLGMFGCLGVGLDLDWMDCTVFGHGFCC